GGLFPPRPRPEGGEGAWGWGGLASSTPSPPTPLPAGERGEEINATWYQCREPDTLFPLKPLSPAFLPSANCSLRRISPAPLGNSCLEGWSGTPLPLRLDHGRRTVLVTRPAQRRQNVSTTKKPPVAVTFSSPLRDPCYRGFRSGGTRPCSRFRSFAG